MSDERETSDERTADPMTEYQEKADTTLPDGCEAEHSPSSNPNCDGGPGGWKVWTGEKWVPAKEARVPWSSGEAAASGFIWPGEVNTDGLLLSSAQDEMPLNREQEARVSALYHARGVLLKEESKPMAAKATVVGGSVNDILRLAEYIVSGDRS